MTRLKIFSHMAAFLLVAASLAACVQSRTDTLTLYFYSQEDYHNAVFEHPIAVTRTMPASQKTMDTALRQLFAGPTDAEKHAGALTSADLTALGPLYLGVRQEGTAAVVNFHADALKILNTAAARQFMVKSPITATLTQFPGIREVLYEIDGKIFDEWDA